MSLRLDSLAALSYVPLFELYPVIFHCETWLFRHFL